jgi:hypothetical protein
MPVLARIEKRVLKDGARLILAALAFWAAYVSALYAGIQIHSLRALFLTAWVFGTTLALFRQLWGRSWFWVLLGLALPIHASLIWLLPEETPFDAGVAMVVCNLELFALMVVIDQMWTREAKRKRHASRRSIYQRLQTDAATRRR